jgi:phenylpropionate dioxygenase-like ring-hydroxylating dioxygenase large terminal subunit
VTKKECGSSLVLGCRYHGWSYDTKGKLVKAPEFDAVPGFDKNVNGLWEIKTEIRESMVFINFDGSSDVSRLDLGCAEDMLKKWKLTQMKCVADWRAEGSFNWKLIGLWNPISTHFAADRCRCECAEGSG